MTLITPRWIGVPALAGPAPTRPPACGIQGGEVVVVVVGAVTSTLAGWLAGISRRRC